jgi:hypothetical protein
MLRRVALVRTDVSEELSTSFIRVTRIGELVTTLALTSNRRIPENTILPSHPRENLKFYNRLTGGGEVVTFTHRPRFTQQKHLLYLCLVIISARV